MSFLVVQLVSLDPKCSLFGGLMLVFYATFSSLQAFGECCKTKNISAEYQHCGIYTDGVHHLDCFGKYKTRSMINCTWKPGQHTTWNTYTLVIQQQNTQNPNKTRCKIFSNITELHKEFDVKENYNMSVLVFENAETTNCTKAIFSGLPKSLIRCDPPNKVSFSRHNGKLTMNVNWQEDDATLIKSFSVRYKKLGSNEWNKTHVQSQNEKRLKVDILNSWSVYAVQIQCDINDKCSQCPWSEEYTVPSEFRTQPILNSIRQTDIPDIPGCRLIHLSWEFSAENQHDGYFVTVWKVSEKVPYRMKTLRPEIRLILSYSAYQFNISAFNSASTSQPANHMIPDREDPTNVEDRRLNVTVHNNDSFTIYWREKLIRKYVCYSVEWRETGRAAVFMSFYEKNRNNKTMSSLQEKLEPYKRYRVTLHTRPNKDTCNMKHINNSESTYGTAQFYLTEGSPVNSPANISFSNETKNSVDLQWSSIAEEHIRGFLLGYIIHYAEYHHKGTSTEKKIEVKPWHNRYKLEDLKSGTAYRVQMSAFTSAGEGVRSVEIIFTTRHDEKINLTGLITVLSIVAIVLLFVFPLIKRAKVILWPSIPNPENSNAVQKIDAPFQLELLEAVANLKVEEWDTKSFQILESEDMNPAETSPAILPLLKTSEDTQDYQENTFNWIQVDADSTARENLPKDITSTFLDTQRTDVHNSPFTFANDYTTMEMFQQLMPQVTESPLTASMENEQDDLTVRKSVGFDYVRQFSTSPSSDSEHMSTVL